MATGNVLFNMILPTPFNIIGGAVRGIGTVISSVQKSAVKDFTDNMNAAMQPGATTHTQLPSLTDNLQQASRDLNYQTANVKGSTVSLDSFLDWGSTVSGESITVTDGGDKVESKESTTFIYLAIGVALLVLVLALFLRRRKTVAALSSPAPTAQSYSPSSFDSPADDVAPFVEDVSSGGSGVDDSDLMSIISSDADSRD